MKVVINKRHGGFELSELAIEKCVKLGMTVSNNYGEDVDFILYTGDIPGIPKYYAKKWCDKEFRSNPILVKVVEELGEESNTKTSKLAVVNIPFDTISGWSIQEHAGYETIHQEHKIWE
jgi:hypothetical protein